MSEFRQRVEAAIPALRRYARALTRDSETADDIVQDTLVRALRSEHLFHDGDVRAWLYTILTNLNRNRLRSLSRRPTLTPIKDSDAAMTGPDTGSRDIARALVEVARQRQITQIVLGQPARSWWEELLRGSIVNRLLRLNADINIHIVPRSDE